MNKSKATTIPNILGQHKINLVKLIVDKLTLQETLGAIHVIQQDMPITVINIVKISLSLKRSLSFEKPEFIFW